MINQKFTLYGITEIDLKIKDDLQLIVREILELLGEKNVQSIILAGSFGKGEGCAFINNDKIKIVNDYDINIVYKGSRIFKLKNKNKMSSLAKKIAENINIKQVDLGLISIKEIKKYKNSLEYYDLISGHRILYGENPFGGDLTGINSDKISLFEGSWLLRNRGIGLILAGLYFIGKKHNNFINKENLWIEINKAKIAIGDSSLILNKKYHWQTIEKLKRIDTSMKESYTSAIISKLEHNGIPYNMSDDKLIEEWFTIKKQFLSYFLKYENQRLNLNFNQWDKYIDYHINKSKVTNLKYWYHLISSDFDKLKLKISAAKIKYDKNLSIGLTALLLNVVLNRHSIDDNLMFKLKNYFKSCNLINDEIKNWSTISKFFLLAIHPEGEAQKVGMNEKL